MRTKEKFYDNLDKRHVSKEKRDARLEELKKVEIVKLETVKLETVKKVEALIKDLKKETNRLDGFTEKAYEAVKEADAIQEERKEIRKKFQDLQKEKEKVEKDTIDYIKDARNKSQVAFGHESANEGLEKRLTEAAQSLKAAAKNLGVPEPPVLKAVGNALSSSQSARILVQDLNDYK